MKLKESGKLNTKTANILKRKNLYTDYDLAEFAPIHYTDYRNIKNLNECMVGEQAAVSGTLLKIEKKKTRDYSKSYVFGRIRQDDGTEASIFAYGVMHKLDLFAKLVQKKVVVCGKISYNFDFGYSILNPDIIMEELNFFPYIKKTYTKFTGMSDKKLRELIYDAVDHAEEMLEPEVRERDRVPAYRDALWKIHNPKSPEDVQTGLKRILYNDLLYLAIMMQKNRKESGVKAPALTSVSLINRFRGAIPFTLTGDQFKAVQYLATTAKDGTPIDVLLQGDVGSGKTIVAVFAMMLAADNGCQSVLMAPRTVLARQHYEEIKGYAEKMGLCCIFLQSGMKAKERRDALQKIKSGEADFIIGTHSCIGEDVEYKNLGLVITDEEHLFGVSQKDAIRKKADEGLHYISMSATPIPRSIASVLYGDSKKILYIKEKPAGRKEIKTYQCKDRDSMFSFLEAEIMSGHQCYAVCPAIEENEDSGIVSIEEVEREYQKYFSPKGIRIGVVNGKMKKEEIEDVMGAFTRNEVQILLSTTVIEVGVNVPNATVMVIEQADRFGLASMHQLRGRVGRSDLQSYCFLFSNETENERLLTMVNLNDGFEIAEKDMEQRGAGNLIGTEQSGLNKFVESMIRYPKLYEHIKETAAFCVANGYGRKLLARYKEHEDCMEEE